MKYRGLVLSIMLAVVFPLFSQSRAEIVKAFFENNCMFGVSGFSETIALGAPISNIPNRLKKYTGIVYYDDVKWEKNDHSLFTGLIGKFYYEGELQFMTFSVKLNPDEARINHLEFVSPRWYHYLKNKEFIHVGSPLSALTKTGAVEKIPSENSYRYENMIFEIENNKVSKISVWP